ncbi:hypothetical protein [Aquimarina algiphila]|uniref:BZIP transcription factor n=1 Tax=Aquimarina algiphila TaxID=2047982 RepID=A0A554VB52_9FLAO|nr:hypothetical protein [Aquimarina algiphila]TSE03622.1 hypothetical protein FOF46_28860 [Aquimarina algiphila]
MKKIKLFIAFTAITFGLHAQNIDLNNSTDYIRIQKNGESDFSRAFGINSSNHMYIGSVEKTIGNIFFYNKGAGHLMTINPEGKIGIGTTFTGNGLLTLNGDDINLLRLENDGPGKEATLRFRSKSNTGGTLHSDISLYTTGNNQGYLGFKVPHNNTTNTGYDMIINHSGNVGIGTINPESWRLAVNGKIRAKEIKVETGWSDFVFYDNYKLPTLSEVESHIKQKGHLKDIPSAKEVEKNGIFLGEMDSKLLQKIEELTLYTIQQQKEIEELKLQNKKLLELQSRLEKLESEK